MEALNEISMLVKEYISPETLWLVPCLYALGIIIKKSMKHSKSTNYNYYYFVYYRKISFCHINSNKYNYLKKFTANIYYQFFIN